MKSFLSFTLLLFSFIVNAQNCKLLNDFTAFHGFQFGSKFPDSLKRYCFEIPNSNYDKSFSFIPTLFESAPNFKAKINSWLWINGEFTDLNIYCLNNDQIYSIILMKGFDTDDSIAISKKYYPIFFENVSTELKNMFGDTKESVSKNDVVGNSLVWTWECDTISIELRMCPMCASKFFSLTITNKELEAKIKLEQYKNQ